MSYTPPDAHSVTLNFEQPLSPVDSHNLVLNFGDSAPQITILKAKINTRIRALITGSNTELVVESGILKASINTSIQASIRGTNYENVDNHSYLKVEISGLISAKVSGINDINHLVGVSYGLNSLYYSAILRLGDMEYLGLSQFLGSQMRLFFMSVVY